MKTLLSIICLLSLTTFVSADTPINPNLGIKIDLQCQCEEDFQCYQVCREFNRIVNISKEIYVYWDLKQKKYNFSFEEEAQNFTKRISDEMTETDIALLFSEWAGLYNDGHVSASIKDLSKIKYVTTDFGANVLNPATNNEVVYIHGSKDDSTFKRYDVIKTVLFNDLVYPIKEWLDLKSNGGSTPAMSRRKTVRTLFRHFGEEVTDRIQLIVERDGKTLEPMDVIQSIRTFDPPAEPTEKPEPPTEDELLGKKYVEYKLLPQRMGYLKITRFTGRKMYEYLDQIIVDNADDFDSLIIDLRYNGGGTPAGDAVLSHMTTEPTNRYKTKIRWSELWLASPSRPYYASLRLSETEANWSTIMSRKSIRHDNPLLTDKKIVVLSGPRCFSACDTFIHAIRTHKFGTVIGLPSGGGTGSPDSFSLFRGEMSFRMSVVYGFNNNGDLIEGNPIKPDIIVYDDLESVQQKVDKTLLKAIDFLDTGSIVSSITANNFTRDFVKAILPYDLPAEDPLTEELSTEEYE